MSMEIRPASAEEMDDFRHVAFRSLILPPEVMPPEVVTAINPDWTLCAFENGKLATSYAAWPLIMQINGLAVPVAGVTCVGTLPIYRGNGYLGKVIAEHFRVIHEKGEQSIVALYASRAAIYQRFGFAVVSTRNTYDFDPRDLQFTLGHEHEGNLREITDEQSEILAKIYKQFYQERNGYIKRGKGMWLFSVLRPPSTPGAFITNVLYEENGEPTGYVIYTAEPLPSLSHMPRHKICIRDLVWLTPSAYRSLWVYLSRMKLAQQIIWSNAPSDDPLAHLTLEPRTLNLKSLDGLLGRIVDVEKALTKRIYSANGTLTFNILDDLCPWNNNRWRLETSGDQSQVTVSRESPEMAMSVSTLGMLLFGQISPSEAARMGRIEVFDQAALTKWDNVMRAKYRPFCADFF